MASTKTHRRKRAPVYIAKTHITGHPSETGSFNKKSEEYALAERS